MAGTVSEVNVRTGSQLGGKENPIQEYSYTFVADASDGSIPDRTLPLGEITGGFIVGGGVDFGTTAPSGLTVTIKDSWGVPVLDPQAFTADGALFVGQIAAYTGQLTVSLSGNSTNSATGRVVVRVQ